MDNQLPDNPALLKDLVSAKQVKPSPWDDLIQLNREEILKGFIWRTILEKPKCKRGGR